MGRATSDAAPHTPPTACLLCSALLPPPPSRRHAPKTLAAAVCSSSGARSLPRRPRGTRAGEHPRERGPPLSPACRHGGEAIDRRQAPPPPPDAAAEQAGGSQELQLPADIDWERLDKSRFFVLGAGLFSAVSAALYPAVVLKTRLQVAPEPPPAHAATGARPGLPPSAAAAATTILRREGPLAFYRGFATSLAGTVPARALYMGALEATRSVVGPAALGLGAPEPAASAAAAAAAGLTAAVAAQVVWTPVDVISQRLMVQGNPCPASRYHGGLDAFRKIVASDGLCGLYRGFGMSILTYAPSNAVWWATYSLSQKIIWSGIGCYLCEYGVGVQEIDDGDGDISLQPSCKTLMVVQGTSAAIAGGAAALVTMPLDTIKTRMQVMDGQGEPITIGRTVRELIKEGGWGACYRGLGPRWASMSLSATTMITTYEFLKRLSAKKGQESGVP
ncbi:solute carrier family 25 member 44-like [Triticum dicoccoides]|uniref:solute carrier family 25 member 44-like n=1 Tax=Triticum dicoccoides TaxID=85692 RepID=UPI00188F0040|nr:solute carrier family 25 member 44-like [Triticum dicoccoides]